MIRLPYTTREFDTILSEITARYIAELPESNDFLQDNIGRFLIELMASIADQVNFVVDRSAAECYVDKVETRENLISLLKLIGFQPANPVPEEVGVRFFLNTTLASDLSIPKDTKVIASAKNLPFTTTSSAVISAGQTSVTVQAKQGEWKTLDFVSNGKPFQRFMINSRNVADGLLHVAVASNDWQQADNNLLVGHASDDTVFRVVATSDYRVMVEFGDNVDGLIPPAGASIRISFFYTQHTNGKIRAREIDQLSDTLTSPVQVTNDRASSGSLDFEDIKSARLRYPAAFASQRRAVTKDDYEAQARLVPGVLQARAVDRNSDITMQFFTVRVYVIANGGDVSPTLNAEVLAHLNSVKSNAAIVEVASPSQLKIKVILDPIYVLGSYQSSEVIESVMVAVEDFFTLSNNDTSEVKLGTTVFRSRLIAAIQAVAGVSSFDITIQGSSDDGVTYTEILDDIVVGYYEYAFLETTTIGTVVSV